MSAILEKSSEEYKRYTPTVRVILLIAAVTACLLEVLDLTIVNVALPTMMGNLGATLDDINWVATGYMLANVVALPMTGWIAAYIGRRKLLLFSISIFTISSFFCGMSPSLGMLITFRIVQGLGGAALMSVSQAMIVDIFPPKQRGIAQAIYGIGLTVGPCIGPILGGYLVDNYSWPWIFFINIPVGLVALVLMALYLRDPLNVVSAAKQPIDLIGISTMAIGLGALQLMLDKGETEGWMESTFIKWLLFFAIAGLISFIIRELTTEYPVVNLRNLKHKGLAAGCSSAFFAGVCMMSFLMILPVFLQNLRGYTAMQTGFVVAPFAVACAITMPVTAIINARVSARPLVAVGAIVSSLGIFMTSKVTLLSGFEHLFWGQVFFGAGISLFLLPLMTAALTGLKGRDLAEGAAFFNLTRTLGGSIGIAYVTTRLNQATTFCHSIISEHVSIYDPQVLSRLMAYKQFFMSKGASPDVATHQALKVMNQVICGQASVLGFENVFFFLAAVFFFVTPLCLFFDKTPPGETQGVVH